MKSFFSAALTLFAFSCALSLSARAQVLQPGQPDPMTGNFCRIIEPNFLDAQGAHCVNSWGVLQNGIIMDMIFHQKSGHKIFS